MTCAKTPVEVRTGHKVTPTSCTKFAPSHCNPPTEIPLFIGQKTRFFLDSLTWSHLEIKKKNERPGFADIGYNTRVEVSMAC